MRSSLFTLFSAVAAVQAATPAGFQPGSQNELVVVFGSNAATSGNVLSRDATEFEPRVGATQRLNGTSYAVLLIDLDLPAPNPPTLLHWLQTGLTFATTATRLNTTAGSLNVFLLQNTTNTAPAAPYIRPNPPARIPLSHRYVEILVDTSNVSPAALTALTATAGQQAVRLGFNASLALGTAGLANRVVAGNFFNVTNPGPVQAANTTTTTGTIPTQTVRAAGSALGPQAALAGLVAVAALVFAL